jgi:hypothetical protein
MKQKHLGSKFEGNTSITLNTMAKVAHLLGKRIEFALR